VAFAIGSLAIGIFVWVAGLIAIGRYWEDLCFDDLEARPGYGSYRSEESTWPPTLECRLDGSDVEAIVVQHPVVALIRFGATVLFPVAYGLGVVLLLMWRPWARLGGPPSGSDRADQ
jgi:hypothetical protein